MSMLKKILNREIISYLLVGGLVTVFGLFTFTLFIHLGLSTIIANTVSNVLAILFAYVTNKIFVFRSKAKNLTDLFFEFVKFCSSRVFLFFVETVLLVFLVDYLDFNSFWMKVFTLSLVIVGNYVFSKWVVFKGAK